MTISPLVFSNTRIVCSTIGRASARRPALKGGCPQHVWSRGKFTLNAEAAENVYDGLTSFRVERIDQTGNEELHGRHKFIVIMISDFKNPKYKILKVWYDSLL